MPNIKEIPRKVGRIAGKIVLQRETDVQGGVLTKSGFVSSRHVPGSLLGMIANKPGSRDVLFEITNRRVRLVGPWREVSRREITMEEYLKSPAK